MVNQKHYADRPGAINAPNGNVIESSQERWQVLNSPFEENQCNGSNYGPIGHYQATSSGVCLISVHGVNHYCGQDECDLKVADLYTGGLTLLLAELCNCSFVINLRRVQDINPHRGRTFADKVLVEKELICEQSCILDLHGCKDSYGFDIALGTGQGPMSVKQGQIVSNFVEIAHTLGLEIAVNPGRFTAKGSACMVRRLQEQGFKGAVQVELARRLRTPGSRASLASISLLTEVIKLNSWRSYCN